MSKVLVVRLSAFGDVAMLVPVVFSVAKAYPDSRFIVLTRKSFTHLFKSLGKNVEPWAFDPQKKHKGISGLLKLRKRIRQRHFTHIADVHDVLRTKVLRFSIFNTQNMQIAHIDKGRSEKKEAIRKKNLNPPLTSTIERYRQVFLQLGFDFQITFKDYFEGKQITYSPLGDWQPQEGTKRIGIAPFARHHGKIYPLEKMKKVINVLSSDPNNRIFLFGGNNTEKHTLRKWAENFPNTICTIGKLFFDEELLLMHSLDVLVSMDSANMHLASIVETKVVSIWGATHPSLGFYGYGQDIENAIQIDLPCRPCSVYGNKKCKRKDYFCLNSIEPDWIIERIQKILTVSDQS